jgi:hypothetical protein
MAQSNTAHAKIEETEKGAPASGRGSEHTVQSRQGRERHRERSPKAPEAASSLPASAPALRYKIAVRQPKFPNAKTPVVLPFPMAVFQHIDFARAPIRNRGLGSHPPTHRCTICLHGLNSREVLGPNHCSITRTRGWHGLVGATALSLQFDGDASGVE